MSGVSYLSKNSWLVQEDSGKTSCAVKEVLVEKRHGETDTELANRATYELERVVYLAAKDCATAGLGALAILEEMFKKSLKLRKNGPIYWIVGYMNGELDFLEETAKIVISNVSDNYLSVDRFRFKQLEFSYVKTKLIDSYKNFNNIRKNVKFRAKQVYKTVKIPDPVVIDVSD